MHVDENGNPDQSLGKVLMMVFLLQVVIVTMVVGILMAAGVIPALW